MTENIKNKDLFFNPNIKRPITEIWEKIQSYTNEVLPEQQNYKDARTDFIVALPPLKYNGKFIKGLYLSPAVDIIYEKLPKSKDMFISMAYSMWASIPWSNNCDVLLTCYNNRKREEWYKKTYPNKQDKIFIGLQDADFTNEYLICPTQNKNKDIDIMSISRLSPEKNIALLLKALIIFNEKYGYKPKTVVITGIRNEGLDEKETKVIEELVSIAGGMEKLRGYIEFISRVDWGKEICNYYSRAKFCVLSSIYEGKNRMINEAASCNTPMVVFRDLCKYTKGEDETLLKNSGFYVEEYTPECLADTIYKMLSLYKNFTPRESYLRYNGRLNFLNKCIDAIPYYKNNLPEYKEGEIEKNIWLKLAIWENYGVTLQDFLYSQYIKYNWLTNIKDIDMALSFYISKIND